MTLKTYLPRMLILFHGLRGLFRRRMDLALENLALRQQLAVLKQKNPRPQISDLDHALWVVLRRLWSKWSQSLIIVRPETVIRWHREGFRGYWGFISQRGKRGRPSVDTEIKELIRQMTRENPFWGAPRIHGELLKLGVEVSERTVSRYLPPRSSHPNKIKQWKIFLSTHRDAIAAMDFFTIPTVTFRILYGFFIPDSEDSIIAMSGSRRRENSMTAARSIPQKKILDWA